LSNFEPSQVLCASQDAMN